MQMSIGTVMGLVGCGALAGVAVWEMVRPTLARMLPGAPAPERTALEKIQEARCLLAEIDGVHRRSDPQITALYRARKALYFAELAFRSADRAGRGSETLPQSGAGPAAELDGGAEGAERGGGA